MLLNRMVAPLRCAVLAGVIMSLPCWAAAQTVIPENVITDSALSSKDVARHSDGKYQEAAFVRLPSVVYFAFAGYQGRSAFADQLLRGLELFAHVAGVKIAPMTTKLNL